MNEINTARLKLEDWIDHNGYRGYDPYDIKSNKILIKLTTLGNRFFFFEVIRELISELILMFPVLMRKLFLVKPQLNAKSLGLLVTSYLTLYKVNQSERYMTKINDLLILLDQIKVTTGEGLGWGYPFDWQSAKRIPANTPNGIVTTAVGEAYWSLYQYTKNEKYLNICKSIAIFLNDLPKEALENGTHCFSYTPLYQNHVHNLNLFVAEFLLKIGIEIGNEEYKTNAWKAINYTLNSQEINGSFDYNGPPEDPQKFYDNYHTSFVIRMLYSINKIDLNQNVTEALQKCYDHWIDNFFTKDWVPKFTPTRLYRIDVHSCAESISCLSHLEPDFPGSLDKAEKIALWTIKELQDKQGYFYHGIFKSRITKRPFKSKIAYFRWGQAWMLRGLSQLHLEQHLKKNHYQKA